MLRFPQAGRTEGQTWKHFCTKSQHDSGRKLLSATLKTVGNGKDPCVETATDSSMQQGNTVQYTGSPTTSPPTKHPLWYATNATTEDAATHTI